MKLVRDAIIVELQEFELCSSGYIIRRHSRGNNSGRGGGDIRAGLVDEVCPRLGPLPPRSHTRLPLPLHLLRRICAAAFRDPKTAWMYRLNYLALGDRRRLWSALQVHQRYSRT